MTPTIRPAEAADLPAIQAIYAHEVETGTASFELQAPDLGEMRQRFLGITQAGYPYLVAELQSRVAGYAYASRYRPRPAYRWTVENSVYIADWARRQGVGRALLTELIQACTRLGLRQMIAVIGDSAHQASIELHRSAGFRMIGTERSVGFKFGRWLDTVHMQIGLGEADASPPRME